MQEPTSWSSTVVRNYFISEAQTPTYIEVLLFLLAHALSVDEHKHSPARMRYSKFVHYMQKYSHTPQRCCLLGAIIPRI